MSAVSAGHGHFHRHAASVAPSPLAPAGNWLSQQQLAAEEQEGAEGLNNPPEDLVEGGPLADRLRDVLGWDDDPVPCSDLLPRLA